MQVHMGLLHGATTWGTAGDQKLDVRLEDALQVTKSPMRACMAPSGWTVSDHVFHERLHSTLRAHR